MALGRRLTTVIVGLAVIATVTLLLLRGRQGLEWSYRDFNLVIVSIDTLRADHLGCYGYARDTSPFLDALAARSLLFRSAYSTAPWTFPAHFSLFTGHFPGSRELLVYPHTRAGWNHHVTLAEVLKQAGYRTIGATGGAWVSGHLGFAQGFDVYYSHGLHFEDNKRTLYNWIDRHEGSEPFFLFVHGYDVHRPYDPPQHLKRRFIDRIPDDCEGVTFKNVEPGKGRCLRTRAGEKYAIAQYDAEILGVDRFLAEFLSRLDRRGLLDRTILVVLSDHGEEFWDHGSVDHINTLYEELIRIPLIIHIPGLPPRSVQTPVSILDLMPTLIDLLELERFAPSMSGRSWLPLLDGRAGERVIHAMTARDDPWARQNGGDFALLGVRFKNNVLIRRFLQGAHSTTELYDLEQDPQQNNDLSNHEKYRAQRIDLDARLDQWIKAERIDLLEDSRYEHAATPDERIQESLRALGYIE